MKTKNNILTAFLLNLAFSVFEIVGGVLSGSVAIISDAVHDMGDALSIGVSYFLEKKSTREPDEVYTYGYGRYSVLGGAMTTVVLLVGSVFVIIKAFERIVNPIAIEYSGMIVFAVIGAIVNLAAAIVTHGGDSVNQKAVNLHMIEDVLGWIVVLIGAVIMRFTKLDIIDPLMSIGVAVFVFFGAVKNLGEILDIFLEKVPRGVAVSRVRELLLEIDEVFDVHHVHLWSLNGRDVYTTMHVVAGGDEHKIKERIRNELNKLGISHVTLELEKVGEHCHNEKCTVEPVAHAGHCHHHR